MSIRLLSACSALAVSLLFCGCGGGGGGGGGGPVVAGIGAQTAKIEIDLATLAITVTEAPTHLTLTPEPAANWIGLGTPLTFGLGIENGYGRLLFNLKAVVESISDVAGTATGDGTFDGKQFFYYGPNALDVAAMANGAITLENLSSDTGTLELELTFLNHKMFFGSNGYYDGDLYANDGAGTGMSHFIDIGQFGSSGQGDSTSSGNGTPFEGCCSADGRYAYFGCRNQPAIIILDTTTMTPTLGTDLTGADNIKHDGDGTGSWGFTRGVTMSPDGQFLYVMLHTNAEMYECSISVYDDLNGTIELVKLNRATLAEVSRVTILSGIDEVHAHPLRISSDGTRGSCSLHVYDSSYGHPTVTVQGKIVALNLVTMTPTIHDVSSVGLEVERATVTPDGQSIYLAFSDSSFGGLYRMPFLGGAITEVGPAITGFTWQYCKKLDFGPDGRLYIVAYSGFAIYNPATNTMSEPARSNNAAYGLGFCASEGRYYVMRDDSLIECRAVGTDSIVPSPADGDDEIASPDHSEGHSFLISPF